MPRHKSDNTFQVALRIPEPWLDRADRLGKRLAITGATMTRADVLRAALSVGLDALENRGGDGKRATRPAPARAGKRAQ